MNQKYLAKFATKNLLTHKLRTLLTIIGMIIGISAIIFLVSFAFGVESIVTSEITQGEAYELIDVGTGNSQIITLSENTMNQVRELPNIEKVLTITNLAAKVDNGSGSQADASLFGTSPEYMSWSGVDIKQGQPLSETRPTGTDEAIISTPLLDYLDISAEEALQSTIKADAIIPKELSGKEENTTVENQVFKVVGIANGETPAFYTHEDSFSEFKLQNFSQAKVKVNSKDNVQSARMQIENLGLKTQYVGETVDQIRQVFSFFELILGSFGLIALIVASLAMFNTLTISLLERTKEVALLKILGMKKKAIQRLFLTEAIIMGIIGGLFGILIGVIFSNIANAMLNAFAKRSGGESIQVFVHPLWFILAVMGFSILVGILTGLYPAKRATRVNALDVLRYE